MTVITHSLSEKKLQKEPLVGADVPEPGNGQPQRGRTLTLVRVMRDRMQPIRQRTSVTSSSCILLTALLLFCMGMAGCAYLYQQYQVYQVTLSHLSFIYDDEEADSVIH
jgi:hypothetical protein